MAILPDRQASWWLKTSDTLTERLVDAPLHLDEAGLLNRRNDIRPIR